jgi:WhiB family transcriptional regulator, redox-sensing transcriptional regulator
MREDKIMIRLAIMKYGGMRETARFAKALRDAEAQGVRLPCTGGGDYWLSDIKSDRDHAVLLCKPCPVRRECLNAALGRDECFGVWGLDLTDSRSGLHVGVSKIRRAA